MYELADEEVTNIAQDLIGRHHQHLREAQITYLFRDKGWKTSCGKTILGKAAKRSEIDKLLSPREEDFIMIISKPDWAGMDDLHKRYLIDHELSHMGVVVSEDARIKWIVRQHDMADFYPVMARYDFVQQELGALIANPPETAVVHQPTTIRRMRFNPDTERSEVNEA